ncbi:hypothetical protein ACSQ67_005626 [Phaseolus vulgaris]
MALTAPLARNAFPKFPIIPFHGETLPSSSSFIGSPLTLSRASSLRGNQSLSRKQCVVFAKKVSGLEEAMNIKRERELRVVTKFKKRPPLRRGRVSPGLPVPDHILRPPYVGSNILPEIASEHQIHDSEGIAKMRAACELAARVLNHAGTLVRPSITTNEIDKEVHQMIIDAGAYPSPLGYGGFPKSVCTSVNECMCHGIPDSRQLQNGDIINIDVTVYLDVCFSLSKILFRCKYRSYSSVSRGGVFGGMVDSVTGRMGLIILSLCENVEIILGGPVSGYLEQRDSSLAWIAIWRSAATICPKFPGFSLEDKANSVGQGIDIPLSREGVFGEWLILLEGSGGYHGDTSKTFFCGEVSDELKNLVKVTEECLEKGIAACKDGALFRRIGKKISLVASMMVSILVSNSAPKLICSVVGSLLEASVGAYDKTKGSRWSSQSFVSIEVSEYNYCVLIDDSIFNIYFLSIFFSFETFLSEHAEKYGFGVVERFVGHGVGRVFHSEPIIIHNRNEKRGRMVEGETFTIAAVSTGISSLVPLARFFQPWQNLPDLKQLYVR